MSATITTQQQQQQHHHRMPLIAGLSVAGVVVAAGVVGVAWHNASDTTTQHQAPVLRTPTPQDYAQYQHYYAGSRAGAPAAGQGPIAMGGLDGHVAPQPPTSAGGLDGHVAPQPPATSYGGRVQLGQ
jgi:hypothetical protein